MSEDQRRSRRQERITELSGGLIRASTADPTLHFRGQRLYRGRQALPWFAAHLHPDGPLDDLAGFRGIADGLALRLTGSDPLLHQRLLAQDPLERLLFETLEQFRAESQVADSLPGTRHNLRRRHEAWSLAFHHAGHTESARGLLLYAVQQICRARIFAEQVVEETEDLLEATRASLSPLLGHAFAGLRRHRLDQQAFAAPALEIARVVAAMLREDDDEEADDAAQDGRPDEARSLFQLIAQMQADVRDAHTAAESGRSPLLEAEGATYQVFARDWDLEHEAQRGIRPALLVELRAQLDQHIAAGHINIGRLARALMSLLAAPERDGWDDAREEGMIDGRRLARLVASPTERRLFRTDRHQPHADCVVTLLLDCSGSMRSHALNVAAMADVLARALEMAGVASEVLGFTTGAWNGGHALKAWRRAGSPAHPGRLNERRHLVFKDGDTSWRRARPAIAALLKGDLFREGLDGEAVEWAAARLLGRPERRRILLVFSDGSPMDSATREANDPNYLDHHLQDVVAQVEQEGRIEIAGVGVGLDLSPYYRRSHVLDLSRITGAGVFRELLELLAGRHHA